MSKKKPVIKIRKRWRINPRTRVKESVKVYKRPRKKRQDRKLLRGHK